MSVANQILQDLERENARLKAEVARLGTMADKLLQHCRIDECCECSQIACPHGDELHFHHDGCPACSRQDV